MCLESTVTIMHPSLREVLKLPAVSCVPLQVWRADAGYQPQVRSHCSSLASNRRDPRDLPRDQSTRQAIYHVAVIFWLVLYFYIPYRM